MLTRALRVRAQLTYANVVASLALFLTLGGGAYAAIKVTGRNVVDSSLTGKDVKNESLGSSDVKGLKATDFAAGQVPAGAKGDTGAAGSPGTAGAPGAPGTNGTNGQPGAPGTNGTIGATGATGPSGPGTTVIGPDAGQAILTGPAGITLVDFNSELYDTGAIHATGADLVVATVPGSYLVTAATTWTGSNVAGTRDIGIVVDSDLGGPIVRANQIPTGSDFFQTVTVVLRLTAGQTIGMRAHQEAGITQTLFRPRMSVQWIGA